MKKAELENKTVKELNRVLKDMGIKGYSRKSKQEIIKRVWGKIKPKIADEPPTEGVLTIDTETGELDIVEKPDTSDEVITSNSFTKNDEAITKARSKAKKEPVDESLINARGRGYKGAAAQEVMDKIKREPLHDTDTGHEVAEQVVAAAQNAPDAMMVEFKASLTLLVRELKLTVDERPSYAVLRNADGKAVVTIENYTNKKVTEIYLQFNRCKDIAIFNRPIGVYIGPNNTVYAKVAPEHAIALIKEWVLSTAG